MTKATNGFFQIPNQCRADAATLAVDKANPFGYEFTCINHYAKKKAMRAFSESGSENRPSWLWLNKYIYFFSKTRAPLLAELYTGTTSIHIID